MASIFPQSAGNCRPHLSPRRVGEENGGELKIPDSLSDNLDLSTASGRLMFQIIGAMAEFERALTQERVKAGIRNARAKGKRIGRPPKHLDAVAGNSLRSQGASWREIAIKLAVGLGTVYRIARERSKQPQ